MARFTIAVEMSFEDVLAAYRMSRRHGGEWIVGLVVALGIVAISRSHRCRLGVRAGGARRAGTRAQTTRLAIQGNITESQASVAGRAAHPYHTP